MPDLTAEQKLEAIRRLVGEDKTADAVGRRWVTFADAAEYLAITDRYLRELVSQGRFTIMRHKPGGMKYLDIRELDEYTERQKQRRDVA